MTDELRVAFIGSGWWSSQVHAPAVRAATGARVDSVTDPDPLRRADFARRFASNRQFSDHRVMLADSHPDCVVVATPHATHAGIVRDCLLSGVPVLVEKPFTLDPRDAWELVAIAKDRKIPLVVGLTYNFHPYVSVVRQILSAGRLGRLVGVSGAFFSQIMHLLEGAPSAYAYDGRYGALAPAASTYSDPTISGGGQAQTQLSHLVGLLLAELPTNVTNVSAQMTWLKPQIDIAVAASMRTTEGVAVSLISAGSLRDPRDRMTSLRFDGTEGWLIHDALNGVITASSGVLDDVDLPPAGEPYRTEQPVLSLLQLTRNPGICHDNQSAVLAAQTVDVISQCYESAVSAKIPKNEG